MLQVSSVVNEVYREMVTLREREELNSDSSRLACAIRRISVRRRSSYQDIEASLDQALAFRVGRIQ